MKTPAGSWLLRTTLRLKRALSAAAVAGPWQGAVLLLGAVLVPLPWEEALSEEPLLWEAPLREGALLRVERKAPLRVEIPPW